MLKMAFVAPMSRRRFVVDESAPRPKFVPRSIQFVIEAFVPRPILNVCRDLIWAPIRRRYGRLPVAEAFIQTYRNALWGQIQNDKFFSGRGSLDRFAAPYVEWLSAFIIERNISTVVDLGCGDFRIGSQICSTASINYVGVDIVPELVEYNQAHFGSERVGFKCADIIEDELPNGELCLLRQVLQHLSNKQISAVLANCAKFRYLLVTEGVYSGRRMRPNVDILHGPDTRVFKRSGVFLDRPPFDLDVQTILEIPCPDIGGVIRTCLIKGQTGSATSG